jgi:serine/threonine-protein kinase
LEGKPELVVPARRRGSIPALFLALGVGVIVGGLIRPDPPVEPDPTRRFAIELPPTETMALDTGPALSISADGMHVVYTVHRGESTELRLRSLDELDPRRVPGTEGAHIPFFEVAGGSFGFFSKGQLYRMAPDDSAPVRLGEIASARGASWFDDRIILSSGPESGLTSMSSRSGKIDSLTKPSFETGERSHRWPEILPGGRHVLFTSWRKDGFDVKVVEVDGKDPKLLVEDASDPRYSPSGHLLFVRDSAILAQAFDLSRLELLGEPTKMIEDVEYDARTGAAFYDISSNGTLVYAPREERLEDEVVGRLLIVGAAGKATLLSPVPRSYQVPRLSPSGKGILMILTDHGSTDVWLMDRERGTLSRITANGQSGVAVWHPEGNRIAYSSLAEGAFNIFVKALDSPASDRRVTHSANTQFPTSWSVDGLLAFVELGLETNLDVWIWNEKTGKSEPLLNSPSQESAAVFSPDGKYLAYVSDETGEEQVYVSEVGGSRRKWPISPDGGSEPVWSRDGTKLFYRDGEWVMSVRIDRDEGFQPGVPQQFVEAPFDEAGVPYANYDVTPEDELVMVRTDEGRDSPRLIVVIDWFTELQKTVPVH